MRGYSIENLKRRFCENLPRIFGAAFLQSLFDQKKDLSGARPEVVFKDQPEISSKPLEKVVLTELCLRSKELVDIAKEKIIVNGEENPYHGPRHAEIALVDVVKIGEKSGLNLEDLALAKIIIAWHDVVIGKELGKSHHERDEIVSARLLKDQIYQMFDLENLEVGSLEKQAWDDLIQRMQVALIATSVDKILAIPIELGKKLGGRSKIAQFDIASKANKSGEEGLDLTEVIEALGYKGDGELIKKIKKSPDDVLARMICIADLSYFAAGDKEKDEDDFWEMVIRYGLEIGVLNKIFQPHMIRRYLEGQVVYLTNYKFPDSGASEELEERKTQNIKRIEDLLEKNDSDLKKWLDEQLEELKLN